MNQIGLIFAMQEELAELLKNVLIEKSYSLFDLTFYETTISNKKCILVVCGVGKVNAARCTQIMIDNFDVDCLFNVGVAGGVSTDLQVCDIVIGTKLVQHDFDITAFNHEKGYIPNVGVFVESDPYLLKVAHDCSNESQYNIHSGVIASGDIFCTEEWMSKKINTKFKALCVDMEGASIAQVCYLCHIPFIVIRSISDIPNNHNVMTYDEFLSKSSANVANYLLEIINRLT